MGIGTDTCAAQSNVSPTITRRATIATVTDGRWVPDDQLVPAILAGQHIRTADLTDADRAWAVAGLQLAGLTVEEVADLLKCSKRLIITVRTTPLFAVCLYAQTETANWCNELSLASSGFKHVATERDSLAVELERTRGKLARLLDGHIVGTPTCSRCGTPWDRGNTYFHGGKRRCRNCNRAKAKAYRERCKQQEVEPAPVQLS